MSTVSVLCSSIKRGQHHHDAHRDNVIERLRVVSETEEKKHDGLNSEECPRKSPASRRLKQLEPAIIMSVHLYLSRGSKGRQNRSPCVRPQLRT